MRRVHSFAELPPIMTWMNTNGALAVIVTQYMPDDVTELHISNGQLDHYLVKYPHQTRNYPSGKVRDQII